MAKKKNKSKASTRKDSLSPDSPRTHPQDRLLHRFYEPLVLLFTLGQTRGDHVRGMLSSQNDIAHLPLRDVRRMFLKDLAYVCDYDKGGETVTAIGLEGTPEANIFWVASNQGSKTKITDFLRTLLTQIIRISADQDRVRLTADLGSQCVHFATPRIKKYRSHLKPLLHKGISYLVNTKQTVEPGLVEWLQTWNLCSSPLDLCHSAYASRGSEFMHILAHRGKEPSYLSNEDAIHMTFCMIKHYIGRLGYHFRAVNTLVACTPRLLPLLDNFQVCSIPVPLKSAMPPPDGLTRLDKILVRMLPANSPELTFFQEALTDMEARYQLFTRFERNYAKHDQECCVHAEIQVLEHFHTNSMRFACDDAWIACSKPACYCCLLYFRHHPARIEEPLSHYKIYLNWRPPNFSTTPACGVIGSNHQRDILNAMNSEIRREVLHQLRERTVRRGWHPDSLSGLTRSEQDKRSVRGIEDTPDLIPEAEAEAEAGEEEGAQVQIQVQVQVLCESSSSPAADGESPCEQRRGLRIPGCTSASPIQVTVEGEGRKSLPRSADIPDEYCTSWALQQPLEDLVSDLESVPWKTWW